MMQTKSDPIGDSTGTTQYLHPKKDNHPMDYPVPNFGPDHDIVSTQANAKAAEASTGNEWVIPADQKWEDLPRTDAEFKLMQKKSQKMMQTKSDPIGDSTGTTQYLHPKKDSHPMGYPVPNFGVDHDVVST